MSNTKSFADNPQPTIYATAVEVHGVPIEAIQAQPVTAEYYVPRSNGEHHGIPVMIQGDGYQQQQGNMHSQGLTNDYQQRQGNFHQQHQGQTYRQQENNGYQQHQGNGYQGQPQYGFEADDIGTCRRCGQQFRRQPGMHSSSAHFYRCERCAGLKFEDVVNSCIIV